LEQVGLLRYDPWDLVLALAWSPDGSFLAVAAGNAIFLYAGSDLKLLQTLAVGAWTTGLAFSPDSHSLAAGSRDGELRVWRRAGAGQNFMAQPVAQWTAHKKGANQIAFSPDGGYLASGGNDAIARVWDAANGSQEQQMIGGTFSVPALAFRPDGEYLAVVNGSLARLRELDSGRIGVTLRADAPLLSLDFSPDGQWIATGNLNNQVEIWEAETGARIQVLTAAGVTGSSPPAFIEQVVYSPDGSLLGSTSSDGSIRLWDPARERLLTSLVGHSRAASDLAFAPDQTRLASGGLDAAVRIWGIP
jgi:Tol biopolymer transport system component